MGGGRRPRATVRPTCAACAQGWQIGHLHVVTKNAELVLKELGPAGRKAVPGHGEIELAPVKMYRTTGDEQYFALARFFLDERGRPHDTQLYDTGRHP